MSDPLRRRINKGDGESCRVSARGPPAFVDADDDLLCICLAEDFLRGGESLQRLTDAPLWASSALFAAALGGLCYFSSTRVLDAVNGVLFGGVLLSFGVSHAAWPRAFFSFIALIIWAVLKSQFQQTQEEKGNLSPAYFVTFFLLNISAFLPLLPAAINGSSFSDDGDNRSIGESEHGVDGIIVVLLINVVDDYYDTGDVSDENVWLLTTLLLFCVGSREDENDLADEMRKRTATTKRRNHNNLDGEREVGI